jgi:hypothetical protein
MNHNYRWIPIVAALVLAALVGLFAYNAGIAAGIAQSGKLTAAPGPAPYPYPYYGWHPWGFPFFFAPIVFFFVIAFVLRGVFWRAAWHRGRCGGYREHLDEWHRQAHEKMS